MKVLSSKRIEENKKRRQRARDAAMSILQRHATKGRRETIVARRTLDSLQERQRMKREKAREAALKVARHVADEKHKLLERSRKRWEDGEEQEDEAFRDDVKQEEEEDNSMTLESILREKEEIRKLLESLDAKGVKSKKSVDMKKKNSDGAKKNKKHVKKKKKAGKYRRHIQEVEEEEEVTEPNESERMLMMQFNISPKNARKTLKDCNNDLVRAVLRLTEMQVEDIVSMSASHIEAEMMIYEK